MPDFTSIGCNETVVRAIDQTQAQRQRVFRLGLTSWIRKLVVWASGRPFEFPRAAVLAAWECGPQRTATRASADGMILRNESRSDRHRSFFAVTVHSHVSAKLHPYPPALLRGALCPGF